MGSWGAGKTHFFRLLREQAFAHGYLVSTVELSAHETPFNKFERVMYAIVGGIASPDTAAGMRSSAPFGDVLQEALQRCGAATDMAGAVNQAKSALFADTEIDIDVRRVVGAYWDTFTSDAEDAIALEERRGLLLQWFAGEAHKPTMRKEFDVQKVVGKENARVILSSLVALVRHLGFKGLVVLFDESEMAHSTMSRSNLKQAHNNLLHLINEVSEVPGLFVVYAAVPQFFTDDRTGIRIYGALAGRIGTPPDYPPRALDKVWNLDAVVPTEDDFEAAATKILGIYRRAYPDEQDELIDEAELRSRIAQVVGEHSPYAATSRWRVVIKETTKLLDLSLEGIPLPDPATSYRETVSLLEQMGDD